MKHLETPFIAAFVAGALLLFVAYLGGLSHPAEPRDYLFYESLQQLNELCRAKYRQSHQFDECARRAEADSLPRVATLFRAMAKADAVQCENCRRAIESLGGVFHTPVVVEAQNYPYHVHLQNALRDKSEQHEGLLRRSLRQALNDGNRYVARLLTWCDASDVKQILILRREMAEATADGSCSYSLCPTCGNIVDEPLRTHFCPHCMTSGEEFLLFE